MNKRNLKGMGARWKKARNANDEVERVIRKVVWLFKVFIPEF